MADVAVEATSGAIGALLTNIALYPVDTAKLLIQTGSSQKGAIGTIHQMCGRVLPDLALQHVACRFS